MHILGAGIPYPPLFLCESTCFSWHRLVSLWFSTCTCSLFWSNTETRYYCLDRWIIRSHESRSLYVHLKSFYLKKRICPTTSFFYCISSATFSAADAVKWANAESMVGHMICSTVFLFPFFFPIIMDHLLLLWFNVMHHTVRNMLALVQCVGL